MNYLALVTKTSDGYAATVPELRSILASEDTLDTLKNTLAEAVAYYLHEAPDAPSPQAVTLADLPSDVQADYAGQDVMSLLIEPAAINPVSLEVQRAIEESGLSYREVARRMGTGHAAISRMADLFYWGHSVSVLRKFGEVIGKQVSVRIWDEKTAFTARLQQMAEKVQPPEDRKRAGMLGLHGQLHTHWRAVSRDKKQAVNFHMAGLSYPDDSAAFVILTGTDDAGQPASISGLIGEIEVMAFYDGFEPKVPPVRHPHL